MGQPEELIIFSLCKIHVTLSGEKIPCFWSVYGPQGLLMGFLRGKITFFGQLRGLQSQVEVEVEALVVYNCLVLVVHFYTL